MRKAHNLSILVAISLALALLSCAVVLAQDEAPIKINLTAAKTAFGPNEAIKLQIRVYNATTADVITREGFFGQNFYTVITFTDPDGLPVRNIYKDETDEPGPPDALGGRPAAAVEIVPPFAPPLQDGTLVGERIIVLEDAREFYHLDKYGWYTAEVLVPMETFSYYEADEQGVLYGFLHDPGKKDYNPVASNKVRFEILPPGSVETSAIHVKVSHLKIGQETKPKTTKTALEGIEVRLIPQSEIPQDFYPINWKTYDGIWAWTSGASADLGIVTCNTDSQGLARFEGIPQEDYLVLAYYGESQDFKHMGSQVSAEDPDWLTDQPIEKNLMVMEKFNGEKMPGKTTRRRGSDLLITEPEFVQWSSDQEKYPFVFETIGEWGVDTSVAPPEGFVADYNKLDAEVVNEIEAVQFTITDVGSRWKETEVKYKIKHKGKRETIKSKIGVKMSKKLQKEKGVGLYGHTTTPGPFKGGKKVGHKKK